MLFNCLVLSLLWRNNTVSITHTDPIALSHRKRALASDKEVETPSKRWKEDIGMLYFHNEFINTLIQ